MANLIILSHVPTHAIQEGFLPAARRLGLTVTVLTDKPDQDHHHDRVIGCDVFNPIAVVDAVYQHDLRPDALFSNSDHLQTSTALAAQFFRLPHKPAQACYLAKHKGEMRRHLQDGVGYHILHAEKDLEQSLPFPCVVKPCKGVASLDVRYVETAEQLGEHARDYWERHPQKPLLVEEFLSGPIYSLETLDHRFLGGFTCTLTELPYFIETGAAWGLKDVPQSAVDYVMAALAKLGATVGACHTEFVLSPGGPRIIEVNYRSIGDQSDFMLDNLMGGRYFELVLRSTLGQQPHIPPVPTHLHSVARYLFTEKAGILESIPEARRFEREGCAVHYVPALKPGDEVKLSHSNKDYLALLHVTGPGVEHVERLVAEEARAVEEALAWR